MNRTDFDITKLDFYYNNNQSMKGYEIRSWCLSNIDNPDYDISFAAKEIYNSYYKKESKSPNDSQFYFVVFNSYSTKIYSIVRDTVMSPTRYRDVKINYETIQNIIDNGECYIYSIKNNNKTNQNDLNELVSINNLLDRRLEELFSDNALQFSIHNMYRYSDYRKRQIYSCYIEWLSDLSVLNANIW